MRRNSQQVFKATGHRGGPYMPLQHFSLGLLLLLWAGPTIPQNGPSARDFCASVRAFLQASYSDFKGIKSNIVRHADGSTEWVPSITVAGTSDCAGQSDPEIASSVYCTGATSQTIDELEPIYQNAVGQLRSCLDQNFVFAESRGGKVTRLTTPIKEASFEVKSKDEGSDGPGVRVELDQYHSTRRTEYELTIWIDAKGKD
jgi:hypothetical protein